MKLNTYKTFSIFRRKTLIALAISFFCMSSSHALLDPDLYLEKSFMEIPTELEDKLSKKIDFDFDNVDLSEMLLLMSKVGDFNIVFPKELDRKVSIQIKQQSIKDTLEDLSLLYDYEFEVKNNSIVFKNKNMNEHFQLIPIKYLSAALVLNILKDQDFNGVKLNKDPSLNNILAVGNIETIRSIEDYVRRVDIAPYQKIFLPEFLNYKAIQRFFKYNLNEKADIELTRIEQNYILLSGKESVVNYAYQRLEEIDRPVSDQAFSVRAYFLDDFLESSIKRLEPEYKRKELFSLDADEINFDSLQILAERNIVLANNTESSVLGLDFEFSREILDLDTVNIHFSNEETFFNRNSDYAIYYLAKKDLKKRYLLKKELNISKNKDLIFVIQALRDSEIKIID